MLRLRTGQRPMQRCVPGLPDVQSDHSAVQVFSKPKLLSQRNRCSIGCICDLCWARTARGRVPWKAPGLWQNSTAVTRSVLVLQQSSELQTGSVAQEAAKACCLGSLSSGRGCTVSTPLFATTCTTTCSGLELPVHILCRKSGQSLALSLPLDFDCRLLTASAVSSILSGGSKTHRDSEFLN